MGVFDGGYFKIRCFCPNYFRRICSVHVSELQNNTLWANALDKPLIDYTDAINS